MLVKKQTLKRVRQRVGLLLSLTVLLSIGLPNGVVSAACPAQDTSRGQVTATIAIPTTGTYRVWTRVKAADSSNNSFFLEIDGTTCGVIVGDSSNISSSSWTWVDYKNGSTATPIDLNLSAGNHSLVFIGREDSVQVDRVIFTTDTTSANCSPPTGTGDACANPTTPTGGGSTGGGSSSGGGGSNSGTLGSGAGSTVTVKASTDPVNVTSGTDVVIAPATDAADIGNVTQVQYYIDGILIATETTAPYTYKVDTGKLPSGAHKLTSKVYFKDGTTKSTTQTLNVKNAAKKTTGTNPVAGIGVSLLIVAAIIGGLILIQRHRGGLRWHGITLIPSDEPMGEDVAAVIRSSNVPANNAPLSNQTPAPGTVVEYAPQGGSPKPPEPPIVPPTA